MIRYHSFYPAHREGEYTHLMNDEDHRLMEWVRTFNPYDLYSKGHERPDVKALTPYYQDLIAEFFPPTLDWLGPATSSTGIRRVRRRTLQHRFTRSVS